MPGPDWEFETPTLGDIDPADTRRIGEVIKGLGVDDVVKVTSNRLDFYIKGYVEEKHDGDDGYFAAVVRFGRTRAEVHANWRDIPEDEDDQQTPYTGLLIEPFDDTSPAVTDIEVLPMTLMTECDDCGYTDTRLDGSPCPMPDCDGEMTLTEAED